MLKCIKVLRLSVMYAFLIVLSACQHQSSTTNIENESTQFTVQVLGINDFHGQVKSAREAGGMYNLSRHLIHKIESTDEATFILHGGDHVGASPAESALLQDEPAIDFLNIVSDFCDTRLQPCEIMGTAGNHEFDEGPAEMLRLLYGGLHKNGPFVHTNWQGARYTTLSANVIDDTTGKPILQPYVVHQVNGVDIGFIGLTLDYTPRLVTPGMVDTLTFEPQLEVAKRYTEVLQSKGVESIIIIVHDGARMEYYDGPTQLENTIDLQSRFGQFVSQLPDAVDLLVTGHSHRFTNVYVKRVSDKPLLVTQAFSAGRAYADISLTIDTKTKDVVSASAEVIKTFDKDQVELSELASSYLQHIETLIDSADQYTQLYTKKVIGIYESAESEISLGKFIANAHRYALNADLGFMNTGGVRAGLDTGEVTWGELFAIQPFGNDLLLRKYTGKQLLSLFELESHWSDNVDLSDINNPLIDGVAIDENQYYLLAGNNYTLYGEPFTIGELVLQGVKDLEATVEYIKLLPQPFNLSSKPIED